MAVGQASHKLRHTNWRKLGGKTVIELAGLVDERLTPPFLDAGFLWVDVHGWDKSFPVSGRQIQLERRSGNSVQGVTISFDKYYRPAFQVHLMLWAADPPHERVRIADVVRRPRQFYCFWGKPWWVPARLWSARAMEKVVKQVAGHIGQSIAFLEQGERGPNISRSIGALGIAPWDGA